MKSVQLIVTGSLEKHALGPSLARLFPGNEFRGAQKVDSFTSARVLSASSDLALLRAGGRSLPSVLKLARALVFAVEPGRRDGIPDLVVAVDDLELVNADQPARVTAVLRAAVEQVLASHDWPSARSRERAFERVHARCSFHLLAPMVESCFFPDPDALSRAGAVRRSQFDVAARDFEDFEVADDEFLCVADGKRHWATSNRLRHPKHYLEFLCTDPAETEDRRVYREPAAARALRELDWKAVFSRPRFGGFARSLVHDIADGLGAAGLFPGDCARHTALRSDGLLRNI